MNSEIATLTQHIKEKNARIEELEQLVRQLQNVDITTDETILMTEDDNQEYYRLKEDHNVRTSVTPLYKGYTTPDNWFVTITFSSKRFRLSPSSASEQKKYILYKLMKAYEHGLFTSLYGTMEYFKTGIVHSHILVKTYQMSLLERYLNEEFNHSLRNKHCIDVKRAHITAAIKYINKEEEDGKDRGDLFYVIGTPKELITGNTIEEDLQRKHNIEVIKATYQLTALRKPEYLTL